MSSEGGEGRGGEGREGRGGEGRGGGRGGEGRGGEGRGGEGGKGGKGREGGREGGGGGERKGSNVSTVLTRNGKEGEEVELLSFLYSSSSSAQLNIVTPSGKPAIMKKASCFKMALWLVTYHEFFAKSVSAL